ncbi:MAG: hypothetical protein IMZ57_06590 [Acidobacteria bacterium]|nr:hypothetical protein [Acidobacteriota bacterium]
MKCYNCDKSAMFAMGPEGQQALLCLDCYIRYQNIQLQQQKMYERQINYITSQMESAVGLHGILPRYPERRSIIQTGGVTLNNIHVTNSEIGVLNTGNIENVDATVTVLKNEGNAELAAAVSALSEAVIRSSEINADRKNQIMELLAALSEEAVAPREKQKKSVVKAVIGQIGEVLGGVSSVLGLWEKARAIFQQVFGI